MLVQVKQKTATEIEPQKYAVGETVRILRPALWSGCVGEVVSFKDGLHRVRIANKPSGSDMPFFHTDVCGSMLEEFI